MLVPEQAYQVFQGDGYFNAIRPKFQNWCGDAGF